VRTGATRHGGTKARRHEGAFSLIEIILVLVVLAALAAIAVPRYAAGVARYRVDAAARRVAAELGRARSLAGTVSADVSVALDPEHELIRLLDAAGLVLETIDLAAPPYGADLVASDFPGGVVTFDGYGRPHAGGELLLRAGSAEARVLLDGQTGEATVP
jgi:general secretion pathway protein H